MGQGLRNRIKNITNTLQCSWRLHFVVEFYSFLLVRYAEVGIFREVCA